MKKKMKFKCHCGFHIIDIDTEPLEGENYIGISIYNHISTNSGKKLKKPIHEGTVVLIGEEARKFKEFIKKGELK